MPAENPIVMFPLTNHIPFQTLHAQHPKTIWVEANSISVHGELTIHAELQPDKNEGLFPGLDQKPFHLFNRAGFFSHEKNSFFLGGAQPPHS
jgi:hypothetical protein